MGWWQAKHCPEAKGRRPRYSLKTFMLRCDYGPMELGFICEKQIEKLFKNRGYGLAASQALS